jgi:hypothetical protein
MDIDGFLEGSIDMFEAEARDRYSDRPGVDKAWKFAERMAERLHNDVITMGGNKDDSTWLELRDYLVHHAEDPDSAEDLELALQARLAWHLCPSFSQAAKRCWELAGLLKRAAAAESARRFLKRVARCYLLGFDPECVIMCRGALENALNARYRNAGERFPKDKKGKETMKVRLIHAEERGWIATDTWNALFSEVWKRGSTAVHNDPMAVGNALGTITLTIQAISTLNPADDLD